MKSKRQEKILELIHDHSVQTQEQLLAELNNLHNRLARTSTGRIPRRTAELDQKKRQLELRALQNDIFRLTARRAEAAAELARLDALAAQAEAAETAKSLDMDYFTTTLSISPLKNAEKLNEIGDALAEEYGVAYLNSDFKKKNGYKRSVELSGQYGMYRQYYCGCVFSKRERDAQIAAKAAAQGI